jgi:transposase
MRMGWYREVQVKSLAAHERMALLGVRRRLVDMRVEIDGQIRVADRRASLRQHQAMDEPGRLPNARPPRMLTARRRL